MEDANEERTMDFKLTKEEKIELLRKYLVDDICFKAMLDTFHPDELDKYLDANIETMLIKGEEVC